MDVFSLLSLSICLVICACSGIHLYFNKKLKQQEQKYIYGPKLSVQAESGLWASSLLYNA